LDYFALKAIADKWLTHLTEAGFAEGVAVLLGDASIPIAQFEEVLAQWGKGKSKPSQRKYLRLAGMSPSLKRNRRLSSAEALILARLIQPLTA
jgi:hypothetical protein